MIEVTGLSKTYGELEALREVSFRIERGEIVGFLGPNGAGKSTTMKILTGYLPQSAGTVTVDGKDINEDSLSVRARVGYLPESTPLYTEMLVYDYLAYVAQIRAIPKSDVHARILETTQLCGIEERLGQEIGTLSKGYRQRVGLAQALLHKPDILILDEPTSGLDAEQARTQLRERTRIGLRQAVKGAHARSLMVYLYILFRAQPPLRPHPHH